MKNINDNQLNNAYKQVTNSTDRDLFDDNFELKVFENTKIVVPYLDTEKTNVKIEKEMISYHNAPPGISFSPGQTMEVAYFKIPIVGSLDLFSALVQNQFYNREVKYVEGRTLIYREYSSQQISGNDDVINGIKERAKIQVDNLIKILENFKVTAEQFNENELKENIKTFILKERDKRNLKSNSENKLNPFS
ncbi:hypothetical protein ACLH3T_002444 [Flavobacterium psychrophilum]